MSLLASGRPLLVCLVTAVTLGLAGCSGGSSSTGSGSGFDTPPTIQTRAQLGCVPVAGPLDTLQTPLSTALTSGLQNLPAAGGVVNQLVTLVVGSLDLVDALVAGVGGLNPKNSQNPQNAAVLKPVLDQALCTTAAAGELLLGVTLDVTTPLADRIKLNGLLNTVVALQLQLQKALGDLANGGAVPAVALLLQQVTNTLGSVLASPLGLTTLPGGQVLGAVLQPVSTLLIEVSGSLTDLAAGNNRAFVSGLLGAVTDLVDGLAAKLGPLGVVLTTVVSALTPVLNLVGNLLAGLLGIAI